LIVSRRDLEAFFKKECLFRDGRIYLDDIEMNIYCHQNALCFECPPLLGLMKFYLSGKKHFQFEGDIIKFTHPLCKFDSVRIGEDEMEITFK